MFGSEWKSEHEFNEYMGNFAIQFECVSWEMMSCIHGILSMNGLKNLKIHEVLLAGLSAQQLRHLLQNLVGEVLAPSGGDKVSCGMIFNQIEALIKSRNDVLHVPWSAAGAISYNSKDWELLVIGKKYHANKNGVSESSKNLSKKQIEELLIKCEELSNTLRLLLRCIMGIRTLGECFSIKNANLVCNLEMLNPIVIKKQRVDLKKEE